VRSSLPNCSRRRCRQPPYVNGDHRSDHHQPRPRQPRSGRLCRQYRRLPGASGCRDSRRSRLPAAAVMQRQSSRQCSATATSQERSSRQHEAGCQKRSRRCQQYTRLCSMATVTGAVFLPAALDAESATRWPPVRPGRPRRSRRQAWALASPRARSRPAPPCSWIIDQNQRAPTRPFPRRLIVGQKLRRFLLVEPVAVVERESVEGMAHRMIVYHCWFRRVANIAMFKIRPLSGSAPLDSRPDCPKIPPCCVSV
jgi:hypothetical protein